MKSNRAATGRGIASGLGRSASLMLSLAVLPITQTGCPPASNANTETSTSDTNLPPCPTGLTLDCLCEDGRYGTMTCLPSQIFETCQCGSAASDFEDGETDAGGESQTDMTSTNDGGTTAGGDSTVETDDPDTTVTGDDGGSTAGSSDDDSHTCIRRQLGGSGQDRARALTIDAAGTIYIAGTTNLGLSNEGTLGDTDVFLARFDARGELEWTTTYGTPLDDRVFGLATTPQGEIVFVGNQRAMFRDHRHARSSGYVAWFDETGAFRSDAILETDADHGVHALAIRPDGRVVVCGWTRGSFEGQTNAGDSDGFVAELSRADGLQWIQQFGTHGADECLDVHLDASGNIVLGGIINFVPANRETRTGTKELFIQRHNARGQLQWTVRLGTDRVDEYGGFIMEPDGHVWLAGSTNGAFDGEPPSESMDAFWARITPRASIESIHRLRHPASQGVDDIAYSREGVVHIALTTNGGSPDLPGIGGTDGIIISFRDPAQPWFEVVGTNRNDRALAVAVRGEHWLTAGHTAGALADGKTGTNDDAFLLSACSRERSNSTSTPASIGDPSRRAEGASR